LACYGLVARRRLRHDCAPSDQLRLRFVDGRPVSTVSVDFLCRWSERRHAARKTAWLLIWDNAS